MIFGLILGFSLNVAFADDIKPLINEKKIGGILEENVDRVFYPYLGLGGSAFVLIPYAANISLGTRVVKEGQMIGLDISGNYTATFISQYVFGKIMTPFYFSENSKNSYFMGPFITFGLENIFEGYEQIFAQKRDSLLAITGICIGKNIATDSKLSFWQIGANMRRLNMSHKENSAIWPTMTFQYGIGF
jgi:hypothetical protein